MATAAWPYLDRNERRVRHARLRLGPAMSRSRASFSVEEALRLASLPGENEGRVYHFRHLRLAGLPADGDRRIWLDRFQSALKAEAASAVHGASPRAAHSAAVFFHSREEAAQWLLTRSIARAPVPEWFWPAVSGAGNHATPGQRIVAIIEQLRQTPAEWSAVATVIFNVLASADPAALLVALPAVEAKRWLAELGAGGSSAVERPLRFRPPLPQLLRRAVACVGPADSRTLWLATLAVIYMLPAEQYSRRAVSQAEASLSSLASEDHASVVNEGVTSTGHTASAAVAPAEPGPALTTSPQSPARAARRTADAAPATRTVATAASEPPWVPAAGEQASPPDAVQHPLFGEPTAVAGLYFLLNPLRWLGVTRLLDAVPTLARADFVPRLFDSLAARAGVAPEDPVRRWIETARVSTLEEQSVTFPQVAPLWPSNLALRRAPVDVEALVRVWAVAVRRWCWRTAGLTLHDVVTRPGRICLTPTALDVTLALEKADVRVRRAGLDVDPGWLPWFGAVVRFHYTDHTPEGRP